MSKRNNTGLPRKPNDFYPTPEEGVLPLINQLEHGISFYEPCAGEGALVRGLERHAMVTCCGMSDISPGAPGILEKDALTLTSADLNGADYLITNPPWSSKLMHPLIDHLVPLRPTWLLLYADWLFTRQAVKYHRWVNRIVTTPRVRWIPGTTMSGKDNSCWILFDGDQENGFMQSGWMK